MYFVIVQCHCTEDPLLFVLAVIVVISVAVIIVLLNKSSFVSLCENV